LWREEAEAVLEEGRLPLVPFVPVLKGGDDPRTVERAVQALREHPRLGELETLLAFFASFVMDVGLVQRIMRWDMAVLRESPWYKQILEEGLQEMAVEDILRVLDHRFGPVPPEVEQRLAMLSVDQLRILFAKALDALSVEAFLEDIPVPGGDGNRH